MNEVMSPAVPYPVDDLPPMLREYVRDLCFSMQVPPELVAPLAMAAAATVVQGLVDVESPFGGSIPTSLFFLAIPRSGDRVSAVMRKVNQPIVDFEEGALKEALGLDEPAPFASHQMVLQEGTEKGFIDVQVDGGDSLIASTDEGKAFFEDMNIPAWCKRWDGDVVRHNTRTSGAIRLKGKRTSMGVTVQYPIFLEVMKRDGSRLAGSGFLPRTLFSMPPSLQGTRLSPEYTSGASAREYKFMRRLRELLAQYAMKKGEGDFVRDVVPLSPEAKSCFWAFERQIEAQLAPYGALHDIPAFAAKAVENVIRLAGVLQTIEGEDTPVSESMLKSSISVVGWHLWESKRAFGEIPLDLLLGHYANVLFNWLSRHAQHGVSQAELLRYGPDGLRRRDRLEQVLYLLEQRGVITVTHQGRSRRIAVRAPRFALSI